MEFKFQSLGPILHWLSLGILCIMPIIVAYVVYRLGRLPGDVARSRLHPQATAVSVCGWMGIITLVLWPLAMVWAYLAPGKLFGSKENGNAENDILIARLHEARQRLAALNLRASQHYTKE